MKKYAVITGASSGIGYEFAKQLAKKGYSLILIARRKNRLQNIAKHFRTECEIVCADLTNIQECERVYQILESKEIAVFINNAGFGDCGPFLESDLDKELQMIHLNVQAMHFFFKRILQKMQKADHGYLLNVASIAGLMPAGPYMATYYASKAYVASLTRAAAVELRDKKSNVYVGCLCPGPVNTEFNRVANVEFALKGISPAYCSKYALSQMRKRKTVIIPTYQVNFVASFGHLLPTNFLIWMISFQQKKKIYL